MVCRMGWILLCKMLKVSWVSFCLYFLLLEVLLLGGSLDLLGWEYSKLLVFFLVLVRLIIFKVLIFSSNVKMV